MNIVRKVIVCFFFLLFVFSTNNVYADFECDLSVDPDCDGEIDDPSEVPLDSGVGLLIGAATLYTIKKIRDKNESNKASELG
ncbi:MAG: PID-CTERM protein-sorting domain-containing protein [Sphingobacteriaceae bacterium]